MRRWLSITLLTASAAVPAVVATGWCLSYVRPGAMELRGYSLSSGRGQFSANNRASRAMARRLELQRLQALQQRQSVVAQGGAMPAEMEKRAAVPPVGQPPLVVVRGRYATAMAMSFVSAALVGGAAAVSGWRRRLRSDAVGLCASCGYDLRATPGRCPECGTATSRIRTP